MKASISVQNFKCGGCADTITFKLSTIENISNLQLEVEENKVWFNYMHEADVL